jgi:large subunit ribosomal protein L10
MATQKQRVRPEKQAIVAEIRDRLARSEVVFLADNFGMNLEQTVGLKKKLRKAGGRFQVVPNGLLVRAASDVDPAFTANLTGATAAIFGTDPVEMAKAVSEFQKQSEKLEIKRVLMERKVHPTSVVRTLAALPDKPVLRAHLLGTLMAPARGLAGVLYQKLSSLVYVLQAVREKREASAG